MPNTVVAIGEALWDVFPDQRRPGGAPCNVAFHAVRLGDRGVIITRVSYDGPGDELVAFLRARGVDIGFVQRDSDRPTGTVSVSIEDAEPRFTIAEDVAWDCIAVEDDARALVRAADAICIGSLVQRSERSRSTIQEFLTEARGTTLVVFDVNLRPPFIDADAIHMTMRMADVVKMSESEVGELSSLLGRPSLIPWLLDNVGVRAVCVTKGRLGASIATRKETIDVAGIEIDTSGGDAVGAGDAFTAALAHQLTRGAAPRETLDVANRYAALIASKKGAMPDVSSDELAAIGL